MVTIRLLCNAGMSTSMLVRKMNDEAAKRGIEVDIVAYPANNVDIIAAEADCVLLGPQIAYRLNEIRQTCKPLGVPVELIPAMDYGMVNGAKVLDLALRIAKK